MIYTIHIKDEYQFFDILESNIKDNILIQKTDRKDEHIIVLYNGETRIWCVTRSISEEYIKESLDPNLEGNDSHSKSEDKLNNYLKKGFFYQSGRRSFIDENHSDIFPIYN